MAQLATRNEIAMDRSGLELGAWLERGCSAADAHVRSIAFRFSLGPPPRESAVGTSDERAHHVRELRSALAGEPEPVRALGRGDGELRGGVEKRVRRLGVVFFLQQRRQAVRVARKRRKHRLRGGEKQLDT